MPDPSHAAARTGSHSGHIRRRTLHIAVATMLAVVLVPIAQAAESVDLKLVLAVDVSGSIDRDEARLQREGYERSLVSPEVIDAIKSGPLGKVAFSYVEWAGMGHYKVVVDWQVVDSAESAHAFVAKLGRVPIEPAHRTSLSGAIDRSVQHLATGGIEGTRRIIDISGDGANNYGRLVNQARDDAVNSGVIINGLPIVGSSGSNAYPSLPDLDLFFRDCVIGGPGAFYVVAHGFEDFARAVRKKLILEIAGLTPTENSRTRSAAIMPERLWRAADAPRESPPCNIGEWNWMSIIQGGTSDR